MRSVQGSLSGKRILDFYRERAGDDCGRRLSEILAWDDTRLEEVHDYIQWLFPLPEPSSANPQAPVLDAAAIEVFRGDGALRSKLHRAFLRMLDFYGLEKTLDGIRPGVGFEEKAAAWLQPGNHNHLRLTRILRSLRILGLEEDALPLFDCLKALYEEDERRISARTFQFWAAAVSRE